MGARTACLAGIHGLLTADSDERLRRRHTVRCARQTTCGWTAGVCVGNRMSHSTSACRLPPVQSAYSAMVTSTSTPGSMEMLVICFTTSAGECRSISRLWMRSSNRSNVLVPVRRRGGPGVSHGDTQDRRQEQGAASKSSNPRALGLSPPGTAPLGVGRRTFTAGGLAGGDAEHLGGHAHGALDAEALLLGPLDQVRAHCTRGDRGRAVSATVTLAGSVCRWPGRARTLLQVGDVAGGQGDADAVHPGSLNVAGLALRLGRLVGSRHLAGAVGR